MANFKTTQFKGKKNKAEFQGKALVGIKSEKKKVWSKRQNKQVEIVERTGVMSKDGEFFKFTLSQSSDKVLKEKGIGFWLEVAVFSNANNNDGR